MVKRNPDYTIPYIDPDPGGRFIGRLHNPDSSALGDIVVPGKPYPFILQSNVTLGGGDPLLFTAALSSMTPKSLLMVDIWFDDKHGDFIVSPERGSTDSFLVKAGNSGRTHRCRGQCIANSIIQGSMSSFSFSTSSFGPSMATDVALSHCPMGRYILAVIASSGVFDNVSDGWRIRLNQDNGVIYVSYGKKGWSFSIGPGFDPFMHQAIDLICSILDTMGIRYSMLQERNGFSVVVGEFPLFGGTSVFKRMVFGEIYCGMSGMNQVFPE